MNLYHYCSNSSFVSIISTKEIWASDFSLANDFMEGKWVREVFQRHCADREVRSGEQGQLVQHLNAVLDLANAAGFCMSEEGDLLSQWRGYADDGTGVAIGFSKEYLEHLGSLKRDRNDAFNASLTKVEYDLNAQKRVIGEILDPILKLVSEGALRAHTILSIISEDEKTAQNKKFAQMLHRFILFFFHLYSLKNPAFAEEREWRIISHILKIKNSEGQKELLDVEFRALRDRVVRYRRIALEDLSEKIVDEIVLGPKNITSEEIVGQLLEKNGWKEVKIRRSSASYR
jgi:hypothetical protein